MIFLLTIFLSLVHADELDQRFERAKALYENFHFNESLKLVAYTLHEKKFHPDTLRLLAMIHEQNQEYFKALRVHYKLVRYLYGEELLNTRRAQLKQKNLPAPSDDSVYSIKEIIRLSLLMRSKKDWRNHEDLFLIAKKYLTFLKLNNVDPAWTHFYLGILSAEEKKSFEVQRHFKKSSELLEHNPELHPEIGKMLKTYMQDWEQLSYDSKYFWGLGLGSGFDSNPYSIDKKLYDGKENKGDNFSQVHASLGKKISPFATHSQEWTVGYFRRSYVDERFLNAEESNLNAQYKFLNRSKDEQETSHQMYYEWHRFTQFRNLSTQTLRHTIGYRPDIHLFSEDYMQSIGIDLKYHMYRKILTKETTVFSPQFTYRYSFHSAGKFLNPVLKTGLGPSFASGDLKNSFDGYWGFENDTFLFGDHKAGLSYIAGKYASGDDFTNLNYSEFEAHYKFPLFWGEFSAFYELHSMNNDFFRMNRTLFGLNYLLVY